MNKFRILALDGASITGGMGWMGVGLLRDYLHRHLELSARAQLDLREHRVFKGLIGSLCQQKKPKIKSTMDFLKEVTEMESEYKEYDSLRSLALSLRFQLLHRWGKDHSGIATAPICTELATMKAGLDLYRLGHKEQEAFLSSLKALLHLPRRRWRELAATANWRTKLEAFETALNGGVETSIALLVDDPRTFLKFRWVTAAPIPKNLRKYLYSTRQRLYRWVEEGVFTNPLFGDINDIDLIAGTSSGGLNALILGNSDSLNAGVHDALRIWTEVDQASRKDQEAGMCNPRKIGAMLGNCSLLGKNAEEIYQRYFGKGKTLKDLKHRVAITTVQLDSGETDTCPVLRRWKPVVFHNLAHNEIPKDTLETDPADQAKLMYAADQQFAGIRQFPGAQPLDIGRITQIEVARATSNIPILSSISRSTNFFPRPYSHHEGMSFSYPQYSGFLDGGFYANNPSMAAITTALAHGVKLKDIAVASLGNGRQGNDHVDLRAEDLGYRSWLLSPERQGLLVDIMLDVGIDAINAYCATILGPSHLEGKEVDGRYLRADIWTDCLFMKEALNSDEEKSLEFQLDEALGIHRYVYDRSRIFDCYFRKHWSPSVAIPMNP